MTSSLFFTIFTVCLCPSCKSALDDSLEEGLGCAVQSGRWRGEEAGSRVRARRKSGCVRGVWVWVWVCWCVVSHVVCQKACRASALNATCTRYTPHTQHLVTSSLTSRLIPSLRIYAASALHTLHSQYHPSLLLPFSPALPPHFFFSIECILSALHRDRTSWVSMCRAPWGHENGEVWNVWNAWNGMRTYNNDSNFMSDDHAEFPT